MKAGFLGLGRLGKAMAQRLLAEGVELTVWNRTRRKARDLAGAHLANSPADVICTAPVVFINLLDGAAVRSVLTGPSGLLEGECPGKVIVDTTTHHFRELPQLYDLATQHGFIYLECPVAGSTVAALEGKLTAFASGDRSGFDQALPYLQKLAASVMFLGQPQVATRVKLINNAVLAAFMATLVEAVTLLEASGLSRREALDVLAAGAGNSSVLNAKRDKLLNEDYSPQFPVSLLVRDVDYAQDLAHDLARPLFMSSIAKELFGLALARGQADRDYSVLYQVLAAG
jgi:3-hydroxyisobutyrate dehydrogenase